MHWLFCSIGLKVCWPKLFQSEEWNIYNVDRECQWILKFSDEFSFQFQTYPWLFRSFSHSNCLNFFISLSLQSLLFAFGILGAETELNTTLRWWPLNMEWWDSDGYCFTHETAQVCHCTLLIREIDHQQLEFETETRKRMNQVSEFYRNLIWDGTKNLALIDWFFSISFLIIYTAGAKVETKYSNLKEKIASNFSFSKR